MAKPAKSKSINRPSDAAVFSGAAAISDAELVRQCLAGKESAWTSLIDRYKNLIYSIPVKYGFSPEDSADIFQSVCMELMAQLPKIREPRALAGWLIQVTSHQCFRRRKDSQQLTEEVDLDMPGSTSEVPEAMLAQLEREQTLREALANLPPRCQRLMHELFFEEPPRPYQDVAQRLGLATGSIGFIRGRCLEKLRTFLNKRGFSAG